MMANMESRLFGIPRQRVIFYDLFIFTLCALVFYVHTRESDSLEAELQAIVCCHVGAGN